MTKSTKNEKKSGKDFLHIRISSIAAMISVCCAIGSRYASYTANKISEDMLLATNYANTVSKRTLEIEENRKLNENKEKSVRILGDLYDKIMYTPGLYDVYIKAANNSLKGDEEYLQRFLDELEGVGYEYCQEQVYTSDLKLYRLFFMSICNNSTIEEKYSGRKNGLSKLCLDILGEIGMGKYYKSENECRVLE